MPQFQCRAIIFDLDGVLVDSAACIDHHWQQWATKHGLDIDEVLSVSPGRPAVETIRLVAPHLDVEAESAELQRGESVEHRGRVQDRRRRRNGTLASDRPLGHRHLGHPGHRHDAHRSHGAADARRVGHSRRCHQRQTRSPTLFAGGPTPGHRSPGLPRRRGRAGRHSGGKERRDDRHRRGIHPFAGCARPGRRHRAAIAGNSHFKR